MSITVAYVTTQRRPDGRYQAVVMRVDPRTEDWAAYDVSRPSSKSEAEHLARLWAAGRKLDLQLPEPDR